MRNRFLAAVLLAVAGTGAASATPLLATVDISTQTMTVERYGEVIHTWPVSTARAGFSTPEGEFRPYRMHKLWLSRTYDNAPMPFAVFYDRGWAVHGTTAVNRLGTPASHGCVRLETANAELFYNLVREIGAGNTRVVIRNEAPVLAAELRQ